MERSRPSSLSFRMKASTLTMALAWVLLGGAAMATEEPNFRLYIREGNLEIRDYPAVIAAEVSVSGSRDVASNAGFRLLAGYIFGGNTRRQSIAMTAPVVQAPTRGESIAMTAPVTQAQTDGGWTVRFILPRSYSMQTLPVPNDPRVHLVQVPASRIAVMRFSGLARPDEVERNTLELNAFIARQHLRAVSPASLARYNPPWTPWFMRRNEVWVPVT